MSCVHHSDFKTQPLYAATLRCRASFFTVEMREARKRSNQGHDSTECESACSTRDPPWPLRLASNSRR